MEMLNTLFSNQLLALFAVLGLGLALGNLTWKGVGLGSSGVLFVALLAGHLGFNLPAGVGRFGLALFVYCVGIGAGGRFFQALAREGGSLAKLALFIVGTGALITWGLARVLDIPAGLSAGIFAGALTSTPALAAATEGGGDIAKEVAIGFGVAYPFGVIGVVLFVQLLPRMLRRGRNEQEQDPGEQSDYERIVTNSLIEVSNPNLYGRRIGEADMAGITCCQISRVLQNGRLRPLNASDEFQAGQVLLLVGRPKSLTNACEFIGRKADGNYLLDAENERRRLAVTSAEFAGKMLRELAPLERCGVVITRITRMDQTFVPDGDTRLEKYDILTVVGRPGDLDTFSVKVGHRPQAFEFTDLVSLALGLALGVLFGMIPLGLPGGASMTLGVAGGPLFVGLILGRIGKVGRLVGHIPRPSRLLLQELGLILFLADAGIAGGADLAKTVAEYGPVVFLMGAAVTLLPMLLAYPFSRRFFRTTRMQTLGGICGGMTSTPALGALTAGCDTQEPVVSYATAYPVALIMMTVFAKLLLESLL